MFLMPGLIIALYTTGVINQVLSKEAQKEMVRYLYNHQNEDGGFGLHIEGGSTMFGTALRYACSCTTVLQPFPAVQCIPSTHALLHAW